MHVGNCHGLQRFTGSPHPGGISWEVVGRIKDILGLTGTAALHRAAERGRGPSNLQTTGWLGEMAGKLDGNLEGFTRPAR